MFEIRIDNLKRFEREIQAYEKEPVEKGKILFVGSSGFTRWSRKYGNRPLEDDIRMKDGSPAAVNHGVGGSMADDLLYYYARLVRPWEPRALVLNVFGNDRAAGCSPAEVMFLCSRILAYARTDFPGIKLYACGVGPSTRNLGNACWLSNVQQFNSLLSDYCEKHDDTTFIPIASWPGFYADPADAGDYFKVRPELYIEDKVHFTQEGYDVYRDLFLHALDDIL